MRILKSVDKKTAKRFKQYKRSKAKIQRKINRATKEKVPKLKKISNILFKRACELSNQSLSQLKKEKNYRGKEITEQDYNKLQIKHTFKCNICRLNKVENHHKTLFIDHCHKTNKVRGLLCLKCNFLLGHTNNDIKTLQSAINYLNRHANINS
jgi:rubrerythrin